MYSVALLLGMAGFGVGYEGYKGGKVFVGVYTPKCEYGWVVTNKEIYLDTIFQKTIDK